MTGASTSKVQHVPTKDVSQRIIPPTTVTPVPMIDTEVGATQATRKLTLSNGNAENAMSEPKRNNRALNRKEANGKCRIQQLNYDWWPEYCQDCMCLGHMTNKCPVTKAAKEKKGIMPLKDAGAPKAKKRKQPPPQPQWIAKGIPDNQVGISMAPVTLPAESVAQKDTNIAPDINISRILVRRGVRVYNRGRM
ncbi:hypothetical protein K7X08_025401 [Anisodus acutangulus]|uniref:Uncharacterized protein n=1 Tax=Anisodus acutangulus TaxID=402998 RepID=A0A9Q1R5S6_9SOLA|nr:hypothetical protein K7X08_025401 [Anisodus acutangulus]